MKKLEPGILSLTMPLAMAALLVLSANATAQTAGEPQEQAPVQEQQQNREQESGQPQEQSPVEDRSTAPEQYAVPHVTGTVARWTGNRIDLKTPEGKLQKVAVNRDTERLVEIKEGAEVKVEYQRKISGFVIAKRVLPVEAGAPGTKEDEPAESKNDSE